MDQSGVPSKPKKENKLLKWLLLALVIVIFSGGGFYYWAQFYREPPEEPVPSPSTTPTPTPSPSVSFTPTAVNWKTYTNQTYGFQLTFTDEWKGYVVEVKRATDPYANAYLNVWVPSSDPAAKSTAKPGYIEPVIMSVYTQAGWDDQQVQEGPKPSIIGRSGNYIVGYSTWQDCPVADINTCTDLNNTWKNNIVPSFKAM